MCVVFGCVYVFELYMFFFFKQKTAYEMRISDWSSDVCSSDLLDHRGLRPFANLVLNRYLQQRDEVAALALLPLFLSARAAVRAQEIGRASCRERVCQYVSISVVAVAFKKKNAHTLNMKRCTTTRQV